jgi:hypothetical protein
MKSPIPGHKFATLLIDLPLGSNQNVNRKCHCCVSFSGDSMTVGKYFCVFVQRAPRALNK